MGSAALNCGRILGGVLDAHPEQIAELRAGSALFNECYNWPKISAAYVATVDGLAAGRRAIGSGQWVVDQ